MLYEPFVIYDWNGDGEIFSGIRPSSLPNWQERYLQGRRDYGLKRRKEPRRPAIPTDPRRGKHPYRSSARSATLASTFP